MSNRDARHTLQILSRPSLLQVTRDVPIYAVDMYGRPWDLGADPTPGVWLNAPFQQFAADTDQGICASVNIPYDRVSGTDIKFYLVYSVVNAPGGGTIMWRIDYLVRGHRNIWSVAPTQRHLPTVAPFSTFLSLDRTTSIIVPAATVDQQWALEHPVEFHLAFIREGTHIDDTETSIVYLLKAVMEYQSAY